MGKCKFQNNWLSDQKYSFWLKRKNENEAICTTCGVSFLVQKGTQSLEQHLNSAKHVKNSASSNSQQQFKVVNTSSSSSATVELFHSSDATTKAELLWTLKCVASNFSLQSCDGIVNIFKAMCREFPSITLGRQKMAYIITDALGPYFYRKLGNDAREDFFTLLFDETTNAESEKELILLIRYWSKS